MSEFVIDTNRQRTASRRINIGCGRWPLLYWTNLDSDPSVRADIYTEVPPIPYPDDSIDEVFAGHVLEHMEPDAGREFLRECYRCLRPGGRLGVVVPDMEEVMRRYLRLNPEHDRVSDIVYDNRWWDIHDMDTVCALFMYSTVQESHHKWMYSPATLRNRMLEAGFVSLVDINRWSDPRITVGAWYQFGVDGVKPD